MENSLLKYIKHKKEFKHYSVPTYFYYNENNKYAQFLFKEHSNMVIIGKLNWRQYKNELVICCNKELIDKNKKQQNIDNYSNYLNMNNITNKHIPLIKSNLQKCIRRSLIEKSIVSAFTLFCLNPDDLLRRLPIIMLEDTILNYHFINLVWFMCAYSKGFKISEKILSYVIGIVKYLASINIREVISSSENFTINLKELLSTNEKLTTDNINLLWAIQLRKAYGGLRGDVIMLDYYTSIWFERLSTEQYDMEATIKPFELENIRLFDTSIIHLSAVDFHCTCILKQLHRKYSDIEKEVLKETIWHHRSKINNKKILFGTDDYDNSYIEIWNEIKTYLYVSSINYISYKFEMIE